MALGSGVAGGVADGVAETVIVTGQTPAADHDRVKQQSQAPSPNVINLQRRTAGVLPVHNIPVVHLGLDLSGDIDENKIAEGFAHSASLLDLEPAGRMALAFSFAGVPEYPRLAAMARAIRAVDAGLFQDEILPMTATVCDPSD